MPRRKNSRHYVVDQLQEEDPESYFKYVSKTPHGVADDQSEFLKAIRNLSVQKVRGFLNKGLDPNFYNNYSCGVEDRVINVEPDLIPLHLAVSGRHTETTGSACEKIVGVLLFFGADPNCKDRYGDSALHMACVSGNLAAVRLLLDAGAEVASVNNRQETALMHLCRNLRVEHAANIVTLLLDKGCPVNSSNDKGKTALIIASETLSYAGIPQRTTVIETLLERGAQVNAKDSEGKSAVIYELEKCFQDATSTDVIRALVCAGAHFCSLERVHINLHQGHELLYPLMHMFRYVSQVLSQRQIRSLQTLVRRMSRLCGVTSQRQMLDALDKVVDITLHVVPTLTQLCRIAVRDCLVGDGSERGERENLRAERGCILSNQGKAVPSQEVACGRRPSDGTIAVQADKICPDSPELGKENLSPGVETSEGRAAPLTEGSGKERLEGENSLGECAAGAQDRARKRRSRRKKGLYEGISVLPLPEKVKTFLMFRS